VSVDLALRKLEHVVKLGEAVPPKQRQAWVESHREAENAAVAEAKGLAEHDRERRFARIYALAVAAPAFAQRRAIRFEGPPTADEIAQATAFYESLSTDGEKAAALRSTDGMPAQLVNRMRELLVR
jgi:hypothetical protein